MQKFFKYLWYAVVGSPVGFAGEGCIQWYYTLAVTMSCMLGWTFLPEVALVFTIISAIHLITVHLYGINGWEDYGRSLSFGYLVAHALIATFAVITNWWWTLITSVLVIVAVMFAPDCCMKSKVFEHLTSKVYDKKAKEKVSCEQKQKDMEKIAMICNTCIFVLFVIVTCLLPVVWWAKLLIVVVFMVIHVLVDYLEGECVNVLQTVEDACDTVINGSMDEQLQKYLEEQRKNNEENTEENNEGS